MKFAVCCHVDGRPEASPPLQLTPPIARSYRPLVQQGTVLPTDGLYNYTVKESGESHSDRRTQMFPAVSCVFTVEDVVNSWKQLHFLCPWLKLWNHPPCHNVETRRWINKNLQLISGNPRCCYRGHLSARDRHACRHCRTPEQRRPGGSPSCSDGRKSFLGVFQEINPGEESDKRPATEKCSPRAGGASLPVRRVHSGENHREISRAETGAPAGHMDLQKHATGEPVARY